MFKNKLCLYIQLMRLNSPIGIFLLLWPPFWVIASSNDGGIYNFIRLSREDSESCVSNFDVLDPSGIS